MNHISPAASFDEDMTNSHASKFFDSPVHATPISSKVSRRMRKRMERNAKQATRAHGALPSDGNQHGKQEVREYKPLVGRGENQKLYLRLMEECEQVFGLGPAGAGKTYLATRKAIQDVKESARTGRTKVYLTRPTVEPPKKTSGMAGFGAVPGDLKAKMAAWMEPFQDGLMDELGGKGNVKKWMDDGRIEIAPFHFMRGRTFSNCVVILDEAQNVSWAMMKMFITRMGENVKLVICGDESQVDLEADIKSGLEPLAHISEKYDILGVGVVRFTDDDIQRSLMTKRWVKAIKAEEEFWSREDKRG